MKSNLRFFIACALTFNAVQSLAQSSERERLTGFAEHYKENALYDKARASSEKGYLEEEERWDLQKNRDLVDYKKRKKAAIMSEDGPESREDFQEKKKTSEKYVQDESDYKKAKAHEQKLIRENTNLPSEAEELQIAHQPRRVDPKKRPMFGGQERFGKLVITSNGVSSGGMTSGGGGRSYSPSSGGSSFPPPPTFDDFNNTMPGYVPAPNMPEDFGDVPPPPPPMPMGDEFGGNPDFPPPPPPPPSFNDGGMGF